MTQLICFSMEKYGNLFLHYKKAHPTSLFQGHSTATGGKEKYRPSYMDHFEKKEQENNSQNTRSQTRTASQPAQQKQVTPPHHFQRSLIDGDFEFVSICTVTVSGNKVRVCYHLCISHTLGTVFELHQTLETMHRYFSLT